MLRKLGTILFALSISIMGAACTPSSEARAEAPVAKPAPAAPAARARAEGQGFVVEVTPPADAKVGVATSAKVVLKPVAPYHVNKEFPTQLVVTPPAGVEVAKAKQKPEDAARFEEAGAEFEVAFTPREAGDKRFEAAFKFAVCTTETCDPKSEKLAWTVPVK
jgi:hypothetical protein